MTPLAISAFLQSSLVIAANGIARLDGCQSIWDESSDEQFLLQDRLVTETLLLALLVNRTSLSPVTSEALQAICLYCAPKIYTRRNLALLDQNPEAAIPLGIGHLALAEMNYGNEEFGDAIRQAFLSGRIFSGVRSPFRAIEARWLESLLFPDRRPAFDDLLPGSLLQAEVHPLLMSPADNHAFTHALMYVTDFGRNPLPGQLSADRLAGMIDITLSGARLLCVAFHDFHLG